MNSNLTPYETEAHSTCIRIRWISVQCYEIVLPNGKVIVTDPFIWDGKNLEGKELTKSEQRHLKTYAQTGFTVDDFTGADYMILNHIHADHSNIAGKLWDKFMGRVLVPGECAFEFARVYNIPHGAIYPIHPGNTYYFDDFTLKTYPGAHDNRSFRDGFFKRPDDPSNEYEASDVFGVPYPNQTLALGYMYNINFMIETANNYKIDFSAGRDYEEHQRHMLEEKPNLMLRHRIRSYPPEYYAKQLEMMGAQFMMPLHHNNARAQDEDLNLYFQKVNEILKSHGSSARAFNPEPYKWYTIQTSIIAD